MRYELQWSAAGDYWEVLARDLKGTWYNDFDVCAGERYHYRIRAYRYVKALGDIGYSTFRGPASRKVPGESSGDCSNKRGATGPVPSGAEVATNGRSITLRFREKVNDTVSGGPFNSALNLRVNGTRVDASAARTDTFTRTVRFEVNDRIYAGDIVTLTYLDPTPGDDSDAFQDEDGVDASSFFDFPVENASRLTESACQAGDILCATMTLGGGGDTLGFYEDESFGSLSTARLFTTARTTQSPE